jgi:hypothetical protein
VTQASINALEWQKICKEHTAAMDSYHQIAAIVNPKMAAIANGTSNTNPTADEDSKFDNAMEALIDVRRRMKEFMKKHG